MPKKKANPDLARLFDIASVQAGYFTAKQARQAAYSPQNLAHHAATGRFERVMRGFYRLREFPSLPHEDVIAAWVKVGPDRAVVSHETALALYELSTVRPHAIDLTVPRERRPPGNRPQLSAVRIHTTTRPFRRGDVVQRFGVRTTSPALTIVDAAEAGTDPDYIVQAVKGALERGLLTKDELFAAVGDGSKRVRGLITRAVEESTGAA